MERSFKKEVRALELGDGETFHGEGILAVTKALLQSGVSYVGGYQGAPVSHLLDVLVDAEDIIGDLGVHLETCTNEASAAAMLGASINYPLRGAVTWKSIVGTNVAADALSNLASPGVIGGVMIILGEDYGEGASVIQERSYAYAMKSSMWLLDPRPDLPTIVRMVEEGFELSEASHAPVMMELRIRACHVTGEFKTKANRRAAFSGKNRIAGPPRFEYGRLAHPPVTSRRSGSRSTSGCRPRRNSSASASSTRSSPATSPMSASSSWAGSPTACCARSRGSTSPISTASAAFRSGAQRRLSAGARGGARVLRRQARGAGGRGRLARLHRAGINVELRRADIQTRVLGKGCLPRAGEYHSEALLNGLAAFLAETRPAGIDADAIAARAKSMLAHKAGAVAAVGDIPARPPNFCTGCPERPVFTAIKLMQRELGPTHISADIGCHSFATFAPFSLGNSILGYGMSLASAAAVTPNMDRRPIAIMGDGGFWHNGLITGVASNLFNKGDGVLIVMQNGYASATGQQYLPSSSGEPQRLADRHDHRADAALARREMAAHGAHLQRRQDGQDAEGGDAHRRARPQGDHRRRRMPARAPAPRARRGCREAQARRARGARALRRRRRDLHRRPFLHPALRLPVAHRQAQSRSVAQRSGRDRDRELRRLRLVRRGRACRRAVSVVLSRRDHPQPELVGSRARIACAAPSSAGSSAAHEVRA